MNTFEHAVVFRFEEQIVTAPSGIVSRQVMKSEKGNISLFAFSKGESLSEHTAPFDALVQVVEGKALVKINGTGHEVSCGESIIMPANISHALDAIEPFKMILTMIKA